MNHQLRDAQTLRLMRAFQKVKCPESRRMVLAIVDAAARGAQLKVDEHEAEPG